MEDVPAITVRTDGTLSLSGQMNECDDVLSNEENTLKQDIENEVPIEERIFCRHFNDNFDSKDTTMVQDSSRPPKFIDSPNATRAVALMNPSLTGGNDCVKHRSQNEKFLAQDCDLSSLHRRRTKQSDTLQITEFPAIENALERTGDTYAGELQDKSPRSRDRNGHQDHREKSPRRGGAVSPKPKSRTPKTLSKIPITKDGKFPMILSLDDDDVNANLLQMSAVVASMDEGMTKVWARFDDQMHRSTRRDPLSDEECGRDQFLAQVKEIDGIDQTIIALSDSQSFETKESKGIDQTITAPIDASSVDLEEPDGTCETRKVPSVDLDETDGMDKTSKVPYDSDCKEQAIVDPCDPPSSRMQQADPPEYGCDQSRLHPSCNTTDATSSPNLYSTDDSRLCAMQKVLVVDLWSDVSENAIIALKELDGLDNKATTELLQHGGHLALIVLLRKWRACARIQTLSFSIVRQATECLTEFADAIVGLGALELILCSLKQFAEDEDLVSAGCGALLNLTLPAKHAKMFVFELNGIQTVTSACARFPSNVFLQKYTLWMIQYFSYWDDFKATIVQAGGMQALAKMIEAFSHRNDDTAAIETILKSASATMKRLL
jgi:hypothetical protein